MPSPFKVILFDLGNTLIHSIEPWNEILYKALQVFYRTAASMEPSIENKITVNDIQDCMNHYYDQRVLDLIETNSFNILKSYLKAKEINTLSDNDLRMALNAMYSITQLNWRLEIDAIPTLSALRGQGYSLGLLSNAADDIDVQQLVDHWELRQYFKFILTSAACGYRKPHSLMFHEAISYFNVEPGNVMMVGDTLKADILGANRMDIFSVWINRRSLHQRNDLEIIPKATIQSLGELIPLINND